VEKPAGTIFRFGPFQADATSGELLKQGIRVRLQEQPFRLLIILLKNAGEVVSKTEIQDLIWEKNTFVDFDSSLRVAVGKLREALGDDAGRPHYIESIPKRGYRFLGPIAIPDDSVTLESLTRTVPATTPIQAGATQLQRWALAAGIILLLAAVSIEYFFVSHRKRPLTAKDMVVLADFDNETGDKVFDDTLRRGLAVQLDQSPFLSLVSDDRVQQVAQMMGRPADVRLTPVVAREVCVRTGSAAVLDGSVAQIGSQYLLTLRAINCVNGETLASAEAQASDKNHVLEALGKTASEIRRKLGESLTSVEKLDTPLEQATTPSLDALKSFSEGWRVLNSTGEAASIPFFKHAVELDPDFALAYAYLGVAHTTIGEATMGSRYTRKAYELRKRTSEAENYFISSIYFKEVTGNLKVAERVCTLWSLAYPRSEKSHIYLSGAIYPQTGEYEKAAEQGTEAVRLNPDSPTTYAFLMFGEIALNHLEDVKTTYREAQRHKLSSPLIHQGLYQTAFVESDVPEMERQVAWSAGKPGTENILLDLSAETAAYFGRLRRARELSEKADDSANQSGETEVAAGYIAQSALREALFGNRELGQNRAKSALKRSAGRDVEYGASLAYAFAGNDRETSLLISDLARRFPEDTIVQFNYLPTLRAKLELNQGAFAQSVETLEVTAPYELGGTTGSSYEWNALYPVFVRGEAYLGAGKGREALIEFRKIVDHAGIAVNEPIGALSHLGLARAYMLQGNKPDARAAYQDFLALWKNADSDIPILAQARAEYDKVR
jgi:eukaryotic-like serine/threonine-protein kinase